MAALRDEQGIMASRTARPYRPLQVATMQTHLRPPG
jgi:hypothetical protein